MATASSDGTARIWTVMLGDGSKQDAALMAEFAEALSGYRVNEFGSAVPLDGQIERLDALRKRLGHAPDGAYTLTGYLRRFLGI